jgi:hypothetical protein
MRFCTELGFFVVLLVISGAALAQDDEVPATDGDVPADAPVDDTCFLIRQAQRMSALHDQYVYLEAAGDRHFLLTMRSVCPGLSGARRIAFAFYPREYVCSDDIVNVVYSPFLANPPMTCPVGNVEPVENREAAEALVAERTE